MQLNGTQLVDRGNRPSVNSKVGIRTYFINDGQYVDPYDVSSCTIFAKLSNASPSSVVDATDGLIKEDSSSVVLMNFGISGADGAPHTGEDGTTTSQNLGYVAETLYTPGTQASGIYRKSVGEYVAVLDGTVDLSGGYDIRVAFGQGITVANGASAVQSYIDVWTVKMSQNSEYQLFINEFDLFDDTFTTLTEPLIITTRNKLINKHVKLGEILDLVVTTEITVQNKTLPDSTKNILRDYQIVNPQVKIQKVNEDSVNQPAREDVTTDFESTGIRVTTDNTILYDFDTTAFTTPTTGKPGTYVLTVKYQYLNQTFQSSPFYFTLS